MQRKDSPQECLKQVITKVTVFHKSEEFSELKTAVNCPISFTPSFASINLVIVKPEI